MIYFLIRPDTRVRILAVSCIAKSGSAVCAVCSDKMALHKMRSALLYICNPKLMSPAGIDLALEQMQKTMDERQLYVAFECSALAAEHQPGHIFNMCAYVYSAAQRICAPLDVRVLTDICKSHDHARPGSAAIAIRTPDRFFSDQIIPDRTTRVLQRLSKKFNFDDSNHFQNLNLAEQLSPKGAASVQFPCLFVEIERSAVVQSAEGCVIGGTFDHVHNGHKQLLLAATLLAKHQFTCGVTTGTMLHKKVLCELIASVEDRIADVLDFVQCTDQTLECKVVPIEDAFGPSIVDENIDCIVVSQETSKGGAAVNTRRAQNNLPQLDVFTIQIQDAAKTDSSIDNKISSSNRRVSLLGTLLRPPKLPKNTVDGKYVIGLTGGICSGKSHIGKHLQSLGALLVDCDQLGHKAYQPDTECYKRLVQHFGDVILADDGQAIDRRKLGAIVFSDSNEMATLNAIVWPEIAKMVDAIVKKCDERLVVVEAAVLLEAGWHSLVHEIWVCVIPPSEACARLQQRNQLTLEQAEQRVNAQMLNVDRVKQANVLFCSLWEHQKTLLQVDRAWQLLNERLAVGS